MKNLRSLSCPSCGGSLAPPLGARRTICPYCEISFFYAGDDFLPRLRLKPEVDETLIRNNILSHLRGPMVPKDLARRALLLENRRIYIPFYHLVGKRGGILKIVDHQQDLIRDMSVDYFHKLAGSSAYGESPPVVINRGNRRRGKEVVDSRVAMGDFQFLYAATSLENWNFTDSDIKDIVQQRLGEAKPVMLSELVSEGEVLDITMPLERLIEKGVGSFHTQGNQIKVLDIHTVVVYLPVRVAVFRYGGAIFKVVVDEIEGKVLSADLPFRRSWAFHLGLAIIALSGLLTGQFGRLIIETARSGPVTRGNLHFLLNFVVVVSVIFGPIGIAGLSAAWTLFRTPFIVKTSPRGKILKDALDTPPSPINPLGSYLKNAAERYFKEGGV